MTENSAIPPRSVLLRLTPDEALVLFEFLARSINEHGGTGLLALTHHDAELWSLNAVHCALESELAEPFRDDYRTLVDAARERLADANGGVWPRDD